VNWDIHVLLSSTNERKEALIHKKENFTTCKEMTNKRIKSAPLPRPRK
jgi:hypothetical protein